MNDFKLEAITCDQPLVSIWFHEDDLASQICLCSISLPWYFPCVFSQRLSYMYLLPPPLPKPLHGPLLDHPLLSITASDPPLLCNIYHSNLLFHEWEYRDHSMNRNKKNFHVKKKDRFTVMRTAHITYTNTAHTKQWLIFTGRLVGIPAFFFFLSRKSTPLNLPDKCHPSLEQAMNFKIFLNIYFQEQPQQTSQLSIVRGTNVRKWDVIKFPYWLNTFSIFLVKTK